MGYAISGGKKYFKDANSLYPSNDEPKIFGEKAWAEVKASRLRSEGNIAKVIRVKEKAKGYFK